MQYVQAIVLLSSLVGYSAAIVGEDPDLLSYEMTIGEFTDTADLNSYVFKNPGATKIQASLYGPDWSHTMQDILTPPGASSAISEIISLQSVESAELLSINGGSSGKSAGTAAALTTDSDSDSATATSQQASGSVSSAAAVSATAKSTSAADTKSSASGAKSSASSAAASSSTAASSSKPSSTGSSSSKNGGIEAAAPIAGVLVALAAALL